MSFFKRTLIATALSVSILIPLVSSAETTIDTQSLIATLQAQIASLQARVKSLQSQQQETTQWCHMFNTNLSVGARGDDEQALETALAREGFVVEHSSNFESTFNEQIASAVTGFQEKYRDEVLTPNDLKYGTGYVGKSTRAKLNQLYGCGAQAQSAAASSSNDNTTTTVPETQASVAIPLPNGGGGGSGGPSIQVSYPNGGETFVVGGTYTIFFVPPGAGEYLIYLDKYFSDSDAKAGKVNSSLLLGKTISSADGKGASLKYTVPQLIASWPGTGSTYKVRVCSSTCDAATQDSSDNYFSIIVSTTLKEQVKCIFNGSTTEQKCYTASGEKQLSCSGSTACTVDIAGYKGEQITWKSSCGGYAYTTIDGVNDNAIFQCGGTAIQQLITITSPNGGEVLTAGQTYRIKWTGGGSNNIDVYLLDNPTRLGKKIFSGIANNGYIDWTIAPLTTNDLYNGKSNTYTNPSGKYVIWVGCSNANCTVDDSNAAFSIASGTSQPSITVTYPNGGESFVAGQGSMHITYKSSGITGLPLTVYLYSPVYNNIRTFPVVASSAGIIDMDLAKGGADPVGQYKINVCAETVDSPSVPGKPLCDSSDDYFSIVAATQQSIGSLTASIDSGMSGSLAYRMVSPGETADLLKLKFSATNEDINVKRITLQLSGTSFNSPIDLVGQQVTIWDGATQVGTAVFDSVSDKAVSTLSEAVRVPNGGSKILTIKGTIAGIGASGPMTRSGDWLRVDYDGDNVGTNGSYGVGVASGAVIAATGADTTSNGVRIMRARPEVGWDPLSSSEKLLVVGNQRTLYKFKVTAKNGDLAIGKFTYLINQQNGASVSDFGLYAFTDYGYSTPDSNFNSTNNPGGLINANNCAISGGGSGSAVEIRPRLTSCGSSGQDTSLIIPSGESRWLKLVGNVNSVALPGQTGIVQVQLEGDAAFPTINRMGQFMEIAADDNNDFIWSPISTTTMVQLSDSDWTNGYGVLGLPSTSLSMETLTGDVAPSSTLGTFSFSSNFFEFNYVQGDTISSAYSQQLTMLNTSNTDILYTLRVNNQPTWLNVSYNQNTLTSSAGTPTGVGVVVNPAGLVPGKYTTNLTISGNFVGSPKVIPINLNVLAPTTVASSLAVALDASSPVAGTVLSLGQTNARIAAFKLTAGGNDITVKGARMVVSGTNDKSLVNFAFYDGTTKIGSAANSSFGLVNVIFSSPFLVPANSSKIITVNADVSLSALLGSLPSPVLGGLDAADKVGAISPTGIPVYAKQLKIVSPTTASASTATRSAETANVLNALIPLLQELLNLLSKGR